MATFLRVICPLCILLPWLLPVVESRRVQTKRNDGALDEVSVSFHGLQGNLTGQIATSFTKEDGCDIFVTLKGAHAHELLLCFGIMMSSSFALGMCCFVLGVRMKPRPPRYWKTWPSSPWSDTYTGEVDVTDRLLPAVQRLFDLTTRPSLMGLGRDGAWATHKGFRVLKVTRIENGRLWSRYARTRECITRIDKVLEQMSDEWRTFAESALNLIDAAHEEQYTDEVVQKFLGSLGLDAARNERLLFHGSPQEGARNSDGEVVFTSRECSPCFAIQHEGFDDRLGSVKGMYGSGTYFADMVSKADQYAGKYNKPDDPNGSVGEKAVMFLGRVVLGCPYIASQSLEQLRRPPCIEGHFDMNLFWNQDVQFGKPWREKGLSMRICDHHRFDSVVGDYVVDGQKRNYREYIVYDTQCYPEFMVEYERTT